MLQHKSQRKLKSECLLHSARCLRPSVPVDTESPHFVSRPNERSSAVPKWLRLNRSAESPTTFTVHRCLLVNEIFCLILQFVRDWDESPPEDMNLRWDRMVGKRTLACLARTCRAFSAPALDALWMRLDSLDPLIKVFPRRMWAKKRYPFIVRMFMGEKQWLTFRKYAERVKSLRGPCWKIPSSVQHNVISALARFPKASFPLLPNLTELIWSELKMANFIDPSVSLIKYFAAPGITRISISLMCWPVHASELSVLSDLPDMCPNLTSFATFFPRSSYNDHSQEIGDLVTRWPHLHSLKSCALPQRVMEELVSKNCLDTLCIELNNSNTAIYVGKLPHWIRKFTLGGNSANLCHRYLQTIQGSPTSFRLRVGADDSTLTDVVELFELVPTQMDKTRLRSLTIELTSSYWSTPASDTFPLTPELMTTLFVFSGLHELDLNLFCSSALDDAEYGRIAGALKELRSLKIGAAEVSKEKPVASVGAVIAVLRCCEYLETLHIAFDGTIPPPPPVPAADGGNARARSTGDGDREAEEEWIWEERIEFEEDVPKLEKLVTFPRRSPQRSSQLHPGDGWGVSNFIMTQIYVGHSPTEETNAEALAWCLKSIMPRLENIRCDRYPADSADKWSEVQDCLLADG